MLTVEDGSIAAGANSYGTTSGARAYASARGLALPADEPTLEAFMIQAMDYLESKRGSFQGSKVSSTQALQFPRVNVSIDGEEFPSNLIPNELINAQYRLCVELHSGVAIMPTVSGPFKIEDTIGPSTTKFSEKIHTSPSPSMLAVEALLEPLYKTAISSSGFALSTVRI